MPLVDFVESLVAALLLGAVIGFERQWRNSAAGLRTNTLVSLGAALFVLFAPLSGVKGDLRVAAQIVSGIGFIGGGAILREGLTIRGVNTAATLWCSAAVGSLCGAGLLIQAAIAGGVILFANLVLRPISHKMMGDVKLLSDAETQYLFRVTCKDGEESRLRKLLVSAVSETGLIICSLHSEPTKNAGLLEIKAAILSAKKNDHLMEKVVSVFSSDPATGSLSWEVAAQKSSHE
ncbi:MAG: MgtC/SapB family protein [Acidobacteriota bacterium]|nr:MgtC/SapB family protein [Acidobacteriota bacterium]